MGYIVGAKMAELCGSWQWGLRATPVMGIVAVVLILLLLQAALEKTHVLKKKPSPVGFFVFLFFIVFFSSYICPEERVFRVFSVSRILFGASRL
jgi:hypothetical protein